jgi:hypothetical protein
MLKTWQQKSAWEFESTNQALHQSWQLTPNASNHTSVHNHHHHHYHHHYPLTITNNNSNITTNKANNNTTINKDNKTIITHNAHTPKHGESAIKQNFKILSEGLGKSNPDIFLLLQAR